MIEGAQSRNNSTLREISSNAVAEFARWSLKQMTDHHSAETHAMQTQMRQQELAWKDLSERAVHREKEFEERARQLSMEVEKKTASRRIGKERGICLAPLHAAIPNGGGTSVASD